MSKYIIGIDTGGTYTDAVLVNRETGEPLYSAKIPTSHFDLSRSTGQSLSKILTTSGASPEEIDRICVSTTLATNSVVENRGARVAILVIGYVKHFKLPVKAVLFIKGGHNIAGEEEEPLDLEYLASIVDGLKNEVDSYGVCSAMSIKNPTHELVAEKAIEMLDPKPVFCSHRISKLTGMEERAATAGLHAKLMPIMDQFVGGTLTSMESNNLTCPLVVIGGNGVAIDGDRASREAALTVASGPACSAHFGAGKVRNTRGDYLVVDVGGTTTDIAMLKHGAPMLADEGCRIGDWKTHVEAIHMHTVGVGGDSHVCLDRKHILHIGPRRLSPLATSAHMPPPQSWLGIEDNSKLISSFAETQDRLPQTELGLLLRSRGPLTPAEIRKETGLGGIPLENRLDALTREQLIFECGFTPTDALHVLDKLDFGNNEVAEKSAEILGNYIGIGPREFAEMALAKTEEMIENAILEYLIDHYWGKAQTLFIKSRKEHPGLGIDFKVHLPIIGLGAAASLLLPKVAEDLKTELIIPKHHEVGNAIGAALIGLRSQ